jgi:4-hydroxy-tetrahydrodipicolinate synthase
VVAGTGSNDTAHSVRLTSQAAGRGVDAVLVVTPYYNKPNRRGLVEHFKAVAAATELPVLVYNIPARCVINLEPDLLAELGRIENVVGVKQANSDMDQARRIVEEAGLALYAGDDNLLEPFAEIGGAGGITVSSHLVGEQMKELYEAARAGDVERARAIDRELADVYRTLFITPAPATVKAALGLLGLEAGGVRLPLVPVDDSELAEVRRMVKSLRPVPA